MHPLTATRRSSRRTSSCGGRTGGTSTTPSRPRTPPGRWPTPTSPPAAARSCSCSTCSRTRPATGLHVGHPLGYIGTDVFARFKRMTGHNVLHAMGFDAFGLPAEQYAVQTGTHPRDHAPRRTSPTIRRQLRRLGLGHDPRRSVATTDAEFYRWTQWIFLQIFNAWYDADADRARPIAELVAEFEAGTATDAGRPRLGASCPPASAPTSSTTTGWPTSARRRSTGAPGWAPCWPTRRSPPTAAASAATSRCSSAAAAVDDAHHRLRRPAARRPRAARLAGGDQGDAAQLDRPQRRRRRSTSRSTAHDGADDRRCSPPGPTRCSARRTWCWRPSTRWSTRWSPTTGPTASTRAGPAAHATPREAVAAYRRGRRARPTSSARREQGEDRRVHRRVRHQPGQRRADPGLRSPTTC